MKKVLMVCLGNICRSPLAEGILRAKVKSENIFVDSAGTAAYHIGKLPDTRSIEVAKKHGIDITNQRARKFVVADFNEFDVIYAMDTANFNDILSLATSKEEIGKVKLLLNEINTVENKSVPDPYYGEATGFENVYNMLDEACTVIANTLIE